MITILLNTTRKVGLFDITNEISMEVTKAGIQKGAVLVYCPHTTAGIVINEGADPDVAHDIITALCRIVPDQGGYLHTEGNSPAHIRSVIVGNSKIIPIIDGKLGLGTWQHCFFAEFDGPRKRKVILEFLGCL